MRKALHPHRVCVSVICQTTLKISLRAPSEHKHAMRSTWHPVCVPGESFRAPRCRSRRRAADQRQHERRGADAEPDEASSLGAAAAYPANLTAGNLAYFLVVPTLIYQPSYPRSTRFRGRWLFLCAPLCRARSGRCQSTINIMGFRV